MIIEDGVSTIPETQHPHHVPVADLRKNIFFALWPLFLCFLFAVELAVIWLLDTIRLHLLLWLR